MKTLYAGSVAKFTDRPDDNEDAFVVAGDGSCVVVCDGASESFDPKTWAQMVAARFATEPLSVKALSDLVAAYAHSVDPATLNWSRQAALERGSFSTLVRVTATEGTVVLTTVGDSLALLTDGETILHAQPYTTSAQFLGRPELLSTLQSHNLGFSAETIEALTVAVPFALDRPTFLVCMTDALGAWLWARIETGDPHALSDVLSIRDDETLAALVEHERAAGRMRRDDTTLVIAMP
jgi:hypothetical protein